MEFAGWIGPRSPLSQLDRIKARRKVKRKLDFNRMLKWNGIINGDGIKSGTVTSNFHEESFAK